MTAGPDRSPWGAADDETRTPDHPRRLRRRRHARRAAGACLAATGLILGGMLVNPDQPQAATDPVAATLCLGAASYEPGANCVQPNDGPTLPGGPDKVREDRAQSYKYKCQTQEPFTDRFSCEFGDLASSRNVALVGNSHAVQWLPALHEVGLRQGFKITTYLSAMCFDTTTVIAWRTPELRQNCVDWGKWARESVASGDYDLVVQTERTYRWPYEKYTGSSDDVFYKGYREHLQRWYDAGKTVLVIRDTPMPSQDVPTCLERHPHDYAACSSPRSEALQRDPLVEAAESFLSPRMRVADLSSFFCHGDECPAVIGRVVVFFDASHVTATYSRSVAPYLSDPVEQALRYSAKLKAEQN